MNIRLTDEDKELIYNMAHQITGTCGDPSARHDIILSNVIRRMHSLKIKHFSDYLERVAKYTSELDHFISAVTIHTTGWFREMPHFKNLEMWLRDIHGGMNGQHRLRILCAACSTGEEAYSFGCVLEAYRRQHPSFEYDITGIDIDPVSISKAKDGLYKIDDLTLMPLIYRQFFISRARKGENHYAIHVDIQKRSRFFVGNLFDLPFSEQEKFDWIACRNVLIYLSLAQVREVVQRLLSHLKPSGRLVLGHCETIEGKEFRLAPLGNSSFEFARGEEDSGDEAIHVLAVDDSAVVRQWLAKLFSDSGMKVFTAANSEQATLLCQKEKIDVVTLDIHLEKESGLDWLQGMRAQNASFPAILLTDVNAQEAPDVLNALEGLAEDYVNKGSVGINNQEFVERIRAIVRTFRSRVKIHNHSTIGESNYIKIKNKIKVVRPDLILIGASTGGTDAISKLIAAMPKDSPPIVCVQHIQSEFSTLFRSKLMIVSGLQDGGFERVRELQPGFLYLPADDTHIGVRQLGEKLHIYSSSDDKIYSHRPSVDFLFQSAAMVRGKNIMAILLTGMGKDGARGLLDLHNAGAVTMVQDELSSVVWGMPGEAVRLGAAKVIGNLRELRTMLLEAISSNNVRSKFRSA